MNCRLLSIVAYVKEGTCYKSLFYIFTLPYLHADNKLKKKLI